ncbi:UDP-N-acetylmuramoyl-L-alanyl-D-glutamate--2,6-diaminopimelate ligase [Bacillaceae bacterium]
MQLKELLVPLAVYRIEGNAEVEIDGLEVDSRNVKRGDLFICLKGFTVDGHEYAPQARDNGAVAVLAERELGLDIPTVIVPDTRRALALIADRFYDYPTQKLRLIGVTGTNGKTTVSYLIERILSDAGKKTGLIGTIKMKIGEREEEVKNTTPDILDLQKSFYRMNEVGTEYAVIEVSSHALDIGRVRGCRFRTAVFTNLTQDHLDYHRTMENYRMAKSLLFSQLGNGYDPDDLRFAVLNADDPAAEFFAKVTAAQVITYGIDHAAHVRAKNIRVTADGTSFEVETFKGSAAISLQMIGKFSVYNALAAIAASLVEGISLQEIKGSLETVRGVPGRFEKIDEGQDFAVIVDYAHTPDGLQNVLQTIAEFARGKVFCVVGCGGDRDRKKRPLMARIATRYADLAIFTSDNPRSENPDAIIDEMVAGLDAGAAGKYVRITDRKQAIEHAIASASPGDVVLIAGKGHETYQIIGRQTLPFDDRQAARQALLARKRGK